MSSVIISTPPLLKKDDNLISSNISSTPLQPLNRSMRQRKKTPKAAAIENSLIALSSPSEITENKKFKRKIKSISPFGSPTLPSNEMESERTKSTMEMLLAFVNQNIPIESVPVEESHPNDENTNPDQDTLHKIMGFISPAFVAQNETTKTNGNSRKRPAATDNLDDLMKINTPNTGDKRKRKSPVTHHNSICENCGTTQTTLWRRSQEGGNECNSCWLYFKTRGVKRPLSLMNREIFKRNRGSKVVTNGVGIEGILTELTSRIISTKE